jgi:uncharacterized DUF497 family protein
MRFEWDETKRRSNIRQHGIDFADVKRVFGAETITFLDNRFDYGETRFLTFGLLWGRGSGYYPHRDRRGDPSHID